MGEVAQASPDFTAMKVTKTTRQLVLPRDGTRAEGIHVSGIIRSMAIKTGHLKCDDDPNNIQDQREISDPVAILRMLLGLAWEQYLAELNPEIDFHSLQLCEDGIHLSPDGISFHAVYGLVVHEFKLTWKSSNRSIEKEWMWLTQIKSYCHAAGSQTAILHVLYINDDYNYPLKPSYVEFVLEFTEEDIRDTWSMIVDWKSYIEEKEREG